MRVNRGAKVDTPIWDLGLRIVNARSTCPVELGKNPGHFQPPFTEA